jgi:hypothetical protein
MGPVPSEFLSRPSILRWGNNGMKDMILEIRVGRIIPFTIFQNNSGVCEILNLLDTTLLKNFPAQIFTENFHHGITRISEAILALHLALRGLPFTARRRFASPLDNDKAHRIWVALFVNEATGTEKDTPAFRWMFHIEIALRRVKRHTLGAPN